MLITTSYFFMMLGSNPMKNYIPYQVFVLCVENQNMNHVVLCKTMQGKNGCRIFQEQKSRYVFGFSLILQKIENCNWGHCDL